MMELLLAASATHADGTPLTFDASNPRDEHGAGWRQLLRRVRRRRRRTATTPTGPRAWRRRTRTSWTTWPSSWPTRTCATTCAGDQSMRTYTIGYGDNSPMLQSIAMAGKGEFYRANNAGELRDALMAALGDIKEVSTVVRLRQHLRRAGRWRAVLVYVPRFIPRRDRPYEGHLYRFFFFSEFSQGCEPAQAMSHGWETRTTSTATRTATTPSSWTSRRASRRAGSGAGHLQLHARQHRPGEHRGRSGSRCSTASANGDGPAGGRRAGAALLGSGRDARQAQRERSVQPGEPLDAHRGPLRLHPRRPEQQRPLRRRGQPAHALRRGPPRQLKKYLLAAGDGFCMPLFAKPEEALDGHGRAAAPSASTRSSASCAAWTCSTTTGTGNTDEDRPCADSDVTRRPASSRTSSTPRR